MRSWFGILQQILCSERPIRTQAIIRCRDKTSGDKKFGDKTSMAKTSVGTKHPWGQNVRGDKTSVETKHPSVGQNIRGDKTSGGLNVRRTKRPADKRPWGQNIHGDKTSVDKTSVWVIFTRALLGNFYWYKSIEREGKICQYIHSLCGRWGGGVNMYST